MWLKEYSKYFRPTDYFFVYCGWYHSEYFAVESERIFDLLKLNRSNFFFMFNDVNEKINFSKKGFLGDIINQNAWLDENLVMTPIADISKIYNAIYVGRFSPFKRHHLAANVEKLALVAGSNHGNKMDEALPKHVYVNKEPLTPKDVCKKINEAGCGLILSAEEGACFASSEYLLCGIPVVSTRERGGRSVWYDEYNSIICDDNAQEIADAVEELNKNPRDPLKIRSAHISKARVYRQKFILKLAELLEQHGDYEVDAADYFKKNFIHKLRKSYKPDFEVIFR